MLKRIVILGPESTGKTTLSSELARRYRTEWVPEYAREHLLTHGTTYTYDDLLLIAQKQLEQEDRIAAGAKNNLLFVDTDMHVMKVWCEFVFNACHQWIIDRIVEREYHFYLLCNTDLPWTKDELREYPDLESRQKLFRMYKENMIEQQTPWIEVGGTDQERLRTAIAAVDAMI
ncbi:MAG TPA: ATP-binding protein [Flavitalea sp.]|nr:ATP-binding protein [Flavitalea sp.]